MKLGLIGNTQKQNVAPVILEFIRIAQRYGVELVFSADLAHVIPTLAQAQFVSNDKMGAMCDYVVAFGGDGTMLSAVNDLGRSDTPILGVNLGGLGFLAEVVVDEMEQAVKQLLAGEISITRRMMLHGTISISRVTKTVYALNDFTVDKGTSARLLIVEAKVDNVLLNTYRSDGVIVATPTGSTAYSLSAGGPIVVPTMNAILVTPICPHSLTVRPIVLSDDSVLRLRIAPDQAPAQVHFDGRGKMDLLPGDWVEIRKADRMVKWVSLGQHDFYEIIRSKLNWGVDLPVIKMREREQNNG